MQDADHLPEIAGEPFGDLAAMRLGGSGTIAAQVERYQQSLGRGERVPSTDVQGLLMLVARRPDADLVLADAGRMAGRMAVEGSGGLQSVTRKILGRRAAMRSMRSLGKTVFDCQFEDESRIWWADAAELGRGELAGNSCRMIGAAVAEALHLLIGFEGALIHVNCRADGGGECAWNYEPPAGN